MLDETRFKDILSWPEMADVRDELAGSEFRHRLHGTRRTSDEGCTGPLCRKATRDRSRERRIREFQAQGREFDPTSQVWNRRNDQRDPILEMIIKYHQTNREFHRERVAS